jgi:hypothetical protein
MKPGNLNINRWLQLAFALVGGTVLTIYYRSWKDIPHLFYDIPAGLAMGAYFGQIVLEGIRNKRSVHWWARVIMLLPMSIVPLGREFFNWNISGHLTDMLAVAMIQTADRRLRTLEKVMYWFPIPIILYIRWFLFDTGGHGETFNALLAGVSIFVCYCLIRGIFERKRNTSKPEAVEAEKK